MKIKLDENLPTSVARMLQIHGHDVHTVPDEQLCGVPDHRLWQVVQLEERFLITQDLDFSDVRQFEPGTHAGLLLVRLRDPSARQLSAALSAIVDLLSDWERCFVVLTDTKIRVKRP